jgi:hypothetical protein
MGRTTRPAQSAGHKPVSTIQPNRAGGKPAQAPPPNAFQGRPERVPQLVYVADFKSDGFLGQASEYYAFFGLEVKKVKSIHEMIVDLGKRDRVFERLCLVSHAHPMGMFLPMFTGAAKGTNKDLFKELAKSDLAGLLVLSPFSPVSKHLQPWATSPRIDKAMKSVRTRDTAGVLKLFGLQKEHSTPPAGDLSEFFFHCFDLVFMKTTDPKALTVKGAPLAAADRQTLRAFVGEVLNQLTRKLDGTSITGHTVKKDELDALRTMVTSMGFDDLGLPPGEEFDLDVDVTTLNSFASLKAIVKAIQGGFRKELDAARSKMSETTLFEIRGCRAAQDENYVISVGEFLGKPGGARPTVTAPQLFQAYMEFMFDTVHDRKSIATWLGKDRRQHTPKQLRENLTTWAELIRVRPLHTDFWDGLFGGPAVRFAATNWPADIPKLFIPTPGLEKLPTTDIGQMVSTFTNFFNVPKAAVPNATALKAIKAAVPSATAAAPTLLAPVKAPIAVERLKTLYEGLKAINAAEGQTIVPETPPSPLSADVIAGFQKGLLDYFDEKPLAALKKFMMAAAENLKDEGDGLVYYLFFAGLPGFVFGRPESQKNSIVVFTPLAKEIQQSWYRCIWADPLPKTGTYLTAELKEKLAHTLPALVGEDRTSVTSVCPLPRYGYCILTRPLPPGQVDGPCGDISNP